MEISHFTSWVAGLVSAKAYKRFVLSLFASPSLPSFVITAEGKLGPGYPLQVRPTPNHARFGLSTPIPGRNAADVMKLSNIPAIPYRRLALILFLLSVTHLCEAQLARYPLPGGAKTSHTKAPKNASARTKALPVVTLPFFDDFSKPYKGMFPDVALWDSSFNVWVNEGMAIKAPTINVATFDGLDSARHAYAQNENEILFTGFTDSLVSNRINLSESGDNPVSVAERGSVFLSFFYQWQGNGEAPDKDDYLQLEFRNNLGKWEPILTIKPQVTFKPDTFYTAIVPVTGDRFFNNVFQFRFKIFGRQSGPYDSWNIDYIYLNKGRDVNDLSFPDRTAASAITSLFHPYTAIPIKHFLASKKIDSVVFDVKNLKNFPASTNYKARIEYVNYVGNTAIPFSKTLVASGGVKGIAGDMEPYERVAVKLQNLPDTTNASEFNPNADSLDIVLRMKVISNDSTDVDRFKYEPINFQINDTVSSTYHLRDYYAYDDGVAEYAAGLIAAGNLSAYEFEIPEGIENVLLKGFDIYIPPFGTSANQTVDFFVYDDGGGEPGEQLLRIPSKTIFRKGIDEFQTVQFFPEIQITQRKFYVGWKEPVSGKMLVGLDMNNDTGDRMFVSTNGFWERNNTIKGSLMIRPKFGTGVVDPTTGIEKEIKFSIYPNPTKGSFYIDGQVDKLEILSVTGQRVPFKAESASQRTFIQLTQPTGLYLLRYTKNNVTKTHKLILSQ